MEESPQAGEKWFFDHDDADGWKWRRGSTDGFASAPSLTHHSFGSAISDAMLHGFSPSKHRWIVEDVASVTHFAPGEGPQVLRK